MRYNRPPDGIPHGIIVVWGDRRVADKISGFLYLFNLYFSSFPSGRYFNEDRRRTGTRGRGSDPPAETGPEGSERYFV